MNHRYDRMYQNIASHVPPHTVVGASPNGTTQRIQRQVCGVPPTKDIETTAMDARSHTGNRIRRNRRPTATAPDRSIDAAMSEPPSANIRPIAGKITVNHQNPSVW